MSEFAPVGSGGALPTLKMLLEKDVRTLCRAPHLLVGVFFFSLVVVVAASFSLTQIGLGRDELRRVLPGIYWLLFTFSGVLALNHSFAAESENDVLSRLVLTPIDPLWIFMSKAIVNLGVLVLIQSVVINSLAVLFSVDLIPVMWGLCVVSLLGAIGFVAIGTLLAGMAAATPGREVLFPILLYPIILPLLAGSIFLTQGILEGGVLPTESFWFSLVAGYDVIAVVLGAVLFESLLRE